MIAEWCILQEVPISNLYYPVDLPCKGDPETRIVTGNGGSDNGSGGAAGSCDAFRVLSPIGFSTFGDELFSWTAVTGADEYVINFQDGDGVFQQAQYVGNVTSTQYFAGSLPNGEFQWIVLALANQQILCSTPGSGIVMREANPDEPVAAIIEDSGGGGMPTVPFSIKCTVSRTGGATILWSNLIASGNTTLSIPGLGSFTSDNGTVAAYSGFTGMWTLSPSGRSGRVTC